MGYLDNTSITVDAVLTKKGREILSNGGSLNIGAFTCSDTGVDYTLWNPLHPDGSAFHGEAIENLPNLEANVQAEYNVANRLVTLPKKTIAMPVMILGGSKINESTMTMTLEDGDQNKGDVSAGVPNFQSSKNLGMTVVVLDPTIVTPNLRGGKPISGTSELFAAEQFIPHALEYKLMKGDFKLLPSKQKSKGQETTVIVIDNEVGCFEILRVVNNIERTIIKSQSTRVIG